MVRFETLLAGALAAALGGTSITSGQLSPEKVTVVLSDGRTQERLVGGFPGAKRFDRLRFSPGRKYAAWEVDYPMTSETYDAPLELFIVGGSTSLEINNGMAVRNWKFLSDHKVRVCTGTLHGDDHNRCDVYQLPQ